MSKNSKLTARIDSGVVEIKSKFDAEFRRFSLDRQKASKYEDLGKLLEIVHRLKNIPFTVCYTDPKDGDLLPINNDDNFARALAMSRPLLRILVQRKGEGYEEMLGYGTLQKRKGPLAKIIQSEARLPGRPSLQISMPEDFRRVSAIIDVDIIPEAHRRVKLMKNGSDKPLGFYIRDGTSVRVTPHGLEKVPGIFISRLVPGGLAESTGLLAVNDEVLEVNGIEVVGKTLDQVTDMMVANSSNLIITVKPVNQRNNLSPLKCGESGRNSQKSTGSYQSTQSFDSDEVHTSVVDEEDEIKDHLTGVTTTASSTDDDIIITKDSVVEQSTSNSNQDQRQPSPVAEATVSTSTPASQSSEVVLDTAAVQQEQIQNDPTLVTL